MNLDIQFKLNNNDNYKRFIRENAQWYKTLNRNPELFDGFINDMKEKYKLTMSDRISTFAERIEMLGMVLSSLK